MTGAQCEIWHVCYYKNKQEMCTGLTTTAEKVILTCKKNTVKIHAKLYESATSHSNGPGSFLSWVVSALEIGPKQFRAETTMGRNDSPT